MKLWYLPRTLFGLVLLAADVTLAQQGVISNGFSRQAEQVGVIAPQAQTPLQLFLQQVPPAEASMQPPVVMGQAAVQQPQFPVTGLTAQAPQPQMPTQMMPPTQMVPPPQTLPQPAVVQQSPVLPMAPVLEPVMSPLGVVSNMNSPPLAPPVESPGAPLTPPTQSMPTQPYGVVSGLARPKGLLSLRAMRVSNPGPEGSKVFFGPGGEFAMGADPNGNFLIQQASSPKPLLFLDRQGALSLGSQRVEAASVDIAGGIYVRGVRQWQLAVVEDFSFQAAGWSNPQVSECAGVYMLGGFCKFSRGEVNKTFNGLPAHTQLRVVATYHFIDRWIGETGFMQISLGEADCKPTTVWSERYAQQESKNGISLCGDSGTPEGKFSVPIDVTIPHKQDSITLVFGSTIDHEDACDESWGISSLEIYVRS